MAAGQPNCSGNGWNLIAAGRNRRRRSAPFASLPPGTVFLFPRVAGNFLAGILPERFAVRQGDRGRGQGEVGAMLYRKRLFQEALYSFLLGNAWSDAALVAEEHLDVTGLREFVDAHENNPRLPERMSRKLRHLLARRLMREGRFEEAGRYFPADLRAAWRDFAEQAAAAKDPALSAERRAAANFRLGQIMLRHDIALFGYELSPDFFICDGQYDQYPIKQRMNRSLPRFHYRLREAGYFQQAGELSSEPSFRFSRLSGGRSGAAQSNAEVGGTILPSAGPASISSLFFPARSVSVDSRAPGRLERGDFLLRHFEPDGRAEVDRETACRKQREGRDAAVNGSIGCDRGTCSPGQGWTGGFQFFVERSLAAVDIKPVTGSPQPLERLFADHLFQCGDALLGDDLNILFLVAGRRVADQLPRPGDRS
ncbi:MAG: hypothetical protein L6W00_23695 [Lentisphaeria bacterium]|nr:MAG: hypothetical protein L6W00_23695 [Lentisphaeria bacterium]